MASLSERMARLRDRVAGPDASVPAPEPADAAFLEMLNAERAAIDRADAEALGNPADYDFGDDRPEPERAEPAEADEPEPGGEDWYLNMLRELRAEITDEHPKAQVMDRAIDHEQRRLLREEHNDEEPS